jgi:hypothetical protein
MQTRQAMRPMQAGAAIRALPGIVIALAENAKNWTDAVAFCTRHGGKLPLINNSETWDGTGDGTGLDVRIDLFGHDGPHWPGGLPRGTYWTGTTVAGNPDNAWFVSDAKGAFVFNAPKSIAFKVVCVPLEACK